ncbi:threonine ammonia-lyase [Methylocaldum sp. GT1BB]|jgi:threonine dehydratase|uniref:threonine ammonia-lyase n=1 Tax=Methylocaldum sp. GT1BB TaxID=3438963 RepID=UPI003DA0AA9A
MPQSLNAVLHPASVIAAPRLSRRVGANLTLVSETFQHTGSFKFRAAYHLASKVPQRQIIAASSGNFGQALAYACGLLGKSCRVVMPATSARVKMDAVREYGGTIDEVDTSVKSRAERLAELAADCPDAYVASAYDDPLVIEGNASLGEEIAALGDLFDAVIAPVGGGGLAAGLITGLHRAGRSTPVIGAEPLLGNDAARSLRAGSIVVNESEPQTLADGARTLSLGRRNWEILHTGLAGIVEVPEASIAQGVKLLFELANLKAEPTGALAVAALLTEPERFRGQSVCCVISGGNVDGELYRTLLRSTHPTILHQSPCRDSPWTD